ncbi:hypothetical protein Tco_0771005 [Tanacetum coccineum]|uniref:Uncharacterized protein n=1 Tax=Tanacetum coccineum TaxID=301880 RepID=A0ABQ4ZDT7_9ASTR
MAESSNPQQEENPPFEHASQVSFNIEDITFNTKNEVALLYPEYDNKDYFKVVSDFISKCCIREAFTISPTQYKEYLSEFWYSAKTVKNSRIWFLTPTGGIIGEVGVNSFWDAIGAHYLDYSSSYVAAPSTEIIRKWFPSIGYGEAVEAKGTLKKSLLPPSSALDSNPSQLSATTTVVAELHKEYQQAAGASTIIHSKSASEYDISAKSKAGADSETSAPKDSISQTIGNDEGPNKLSLDHISAGASKTTQKTEEEVTKSSNLSSSDKTQKEIKLEDLSKLVKNVHIDFMDIDFQDDLVIIIDASEEEEDELKKNKAEAEVALLSAQPSFPSIAQLTELLVKSLTPEFSKDLSAYDFSSSLPTKLKELPSKFTDITGEVKDLKKNVHDLEIKLPRDLKEIPNKLKAEFLSVPTQIQAIQAKLKTLDALSNLLNKATQALNKFA